MRQDVYNLMDHIEGSTPLSRSYSERIGRIDIVNTGNVEITLKINGRNQYDTNTPIAITIPAGNTWGYGVDATGFEVEGVSTCKIDIGG